MNTIDDRFTVDNVYGFQSAFRTWLRAVHEARRLAKRDGVKAQVFDRMAQPGSWQLWTVMPDGEIIEDERRQAQLTPGGTSRII